MSENGSESREWMVTWPRGCPHPSCGYVTNDATITACIVCNGPLESFDEATVKLLSRAARLWRLRWMGAPALITSREKAMIMAAVHEIIEADNVPMDEVLLEQLRSERRQASP